MISWLWVAIAILTTWLTMMTIEAYHTQSELTHVHNRVHQLVEMQESHHQEGG